MNKIVTAFFVMLACCSIAAVNASAQVKTDRSQTNPREFQSDGCTLFPDGDYRNCCVEHDRAYFAGGPIKERRRADNRLYRCVASSGGQNKKFIASMMWIGVRVGGVSFLPTPFRWGFGKPYFRK